MTKDNFIIVKRKANSLNLTPEKIISGVRLFKGKLSIYFDEVVETQMEVLCLKLEDVNNLSTLFTFAKSKKVEFYYIVENETRKLKMKSTEIVETKKSENKKENNFDFESFFKNGNYGDIFHNFFWWGK